MLRVNLTERELELKNANSHYSVQDLCPVHSQLSHSYPKNQRLTYNFPKEERLGRIEDRVRGAGQMVTRSRIMVEL